MKTSAWRWASIGTLGVGLLAGLILGSGRSVLLAQRQPRAALDTPAASPPSRPQPAPHPGDTDEAVYRQLDQQYERFRLVDQTFAMVARTVAPSVVHMVAQKTGERDDGQLARFEETGSGVIVRGEDGTGRYVLTNNHVVQGAAARDIAIFLHDGQVLHPDRVWSDTRADVAVLKLARDDLAAARLGDSDAAPVGSWVLALGSPFGLTQSVSQGIISARGRYEQELEADGVEHQEFLQTDAAINPGNSGGPLVNLKGEVIGINTAIASNGGGSEGVGFSIPVNLAKWAMRQLVTTGRVSRGAIGVKLGGISPTEAIELGLTSPKGARVVEVEENTPASRAGIVIGDVILKFNESDVQDFNHLINLVSMTPIGRISHMVLWREKQRRNVEITIADRDAILARGAPAPPEADPRSPASTRPARPLTPDGVDAVTISNEAQAKRHDLPSDARGVLVLRVAPSSPLNDWLRPKDIVESFTGARGAPRSLAEIENAVRQALSNPAFELQIRRLEPQGYVPASVRLRE